jgi:cell division protein FtsB
MSDRKRQGETGAAWPGDGTPRGGTGTLTRPAGPGAEPRPRRPGPTVAPPVAPRQGRRPQATIQPPRKRVAQRAAARRTTHRMPFFLLLCGLLGGALVSVLVISTTLAAGSFEITRLQQSNDALARQRQQLQEQVAAAQSAQVIEQRAYQLGMRPVGVLRFINLKTGKIATDAGSGAVPASQVPGYTP